MPTKLRQGWATINAAVTVDGLTGPDGKYLSRTLKTPKGELSVALGPDAFPGIAPGATLIMSLTIIQSILEELPEEFAPKTLIIPQRAN